ncbi:nucleotide cyclase [Encephalitozoon intestinalis]|nr:nucleotide cyclase [Encephalitozoon intestinalis]
MNYILIPEIEVTDLTHFTSTKDSEHQSLLIFSAHYCFAIVTSFLFFFSMYFMITRTITTDPHQLFKFIFLLHPFSYFTIYNFFLSANPAHSSYQSSSTFLFLFSSILEFVKSFASTFVLILTSSFLIFLTIEDPSLPSKFFITLLSFPLPCPLQVSRPEVCFTPQASL